MSKALCGIRYATTIVALAAACPAAFAAALTTGNILVVQVGDGVAAPSTNAAPVSLIEYTPAGVQVQVFSLPSTGANACTLRGNGSTEGQLHISANGQYFTMAGYAVAAGTANPATSGNIRTVARLKMDGTLDTTTHMDATLASGSDIRACVSNTGSEFWVSTGDKSVIYLPTFGATQAGTQLSTTVSNLRDVAIFGGNLYINSASGSFHGAAQVGTGLPTTSGQTIAILPGFPTATEGPTSLFFDSATRIYQAGFGGGSGFDNAAIQQWDLASGTWSKTGTFTSSSTAAEGTAAVTVGIDGATPTIYFSVFPSTSTNNNTIVKTQKASPGTLTPTVAVAPLNTFFRGIAAIVPPPAAVEQWSMY